MLQKLGQTHRVRPNAATLASCAERERFANISLVDALIGATPEVNGGIAKVS